MSAARTTISIAWPITPIAHSPICRGRGGRSRCGRSRICRRLRRADQVRRRTPRGRRCAHGLGEIVVIVLARYHVLLMGVGVVVVVVACCGVAVVISSQRVRGERHAAVVVLSGGLRGAMV